MTKLKVWVTRTFRPECPSFSRTCIHVHKPKSYGMLCYCMLSREDVANGITGIGWGGESVRLPEGKHLGLKPGECKRATLIIEE